MSDGAQRQCEHKKQKTYSFGNPTPTSQRREELGLRVISQSSVSKQNKNYTNNDTTKIESVYNIQKYTGIHKAKNIF